MKVDPWIMEGTANRAFVELAIRIEKMKRELGKAFGYDRGPWMQRRGAGNGDNDNE